MIEGLQNPGFCSAVLVAFWMLWVTIKVCVDVELYEVEAELLRKQVRSQVLDGTYWPERWRREEPAAWKNFDLAWEEYEKQQLARDRAADERQMNGDWSKDLAVSALEDLERAFESKTAKEIAALVGVVAAAILEIVP